jgi:hypothetical protein
MDPEKRRRLGEYIKARHFELSACGHISWKVQSLTLKHAADRLYELYLEAMNRSFKRISEQVEKNDGSIEGSRVLEGQELLDFWDESLMSVYFMLMGYSLENLLKAILMIQHPEYFKPNQKLIDLRTHDLVDLCRRCKIKLLKEEANLLRELTVFIEWKGKYPIALLSKEMWGKIKEDGTVIPRGAINYKEKQKVESLYIKFSKELDLIKPAEVKLKTSPPF